MALAERGLLDLDEPVHKRIDPWLAAHTPPVPALRELFGGDAKVNLITARQLLQMRSGLPDYNDQKLLRWSLANPMVRPSTHPTAACAC